MSYSIPSLYESVGGVTFPVNPDDFTTSFAPLDPARDLLLDLFKTAINAELSEVWEKVTSTVTQAGSKYAGTLPVQDTIPGRPSLGMMQVRKTGFPFLALHREGDAEFEEYLMDEIRVKQTWNLHYIFGPGDVEVERKLLDFSQAVRALVFLVIRQRGHKAFDGGAIQFFPGNGTLSSVKLTKCTPVGKAIFNEDETAAYWAMVMTLETTEDSSYNEDAIMDLEGIDLNAALADGQEVLADFAQASSDQTGEV